MSSTECHITPSLVVEEKRDIFFKLVFYNKEVYQWNTVRKYHNLIVIAVISQNFVDNVILTDCFLPLVRLETCVTLRTVAATKNGRPKIEQTTMRSATMSKSRW